MNIDYVPLLQIQRDLQGLPRNYDRFRQYLRKIVTPNGKALDLPPLLYMNPMGKDHVTALLDALLALDADGIAARAAAETAAELAETLGDYKATLVIADDLMGGWTNRYDYEFTLRFGPEPYRLSPPQNLVLPRWTQHIWITGLLWSSEAASEQGVREAIVTAIHRWAYLLRHGAVRTLRDMLTQEGHVMAAAGCTGPTLDADDLEYTREVLIPYLDADDKRTAIQCLFGDAAGRTLGFAPVGLSPWAGLALALHDAKRGQCAIRRGPRSRPDAIANEPASVLPGPAPRLQYG